MTNMAKRKTTAKAKDSGIELDSRETLGAWVSASLIPGEAPTSRFNNNTGRDYELVTRGITGTAWRAASINATVLSGQTLRLFRKVGSGSGKGRKVADKRVMKHATNRGKVKSLVGKAAMYASRAGDDIEEVLDHPILDLLQNPDPVYTGPLWLWQLFWFKEVAGRAYLYVGERLNGYPVSAYILPSEFAWPMLSDTGLIEGYFYGRNRSHPMRVPAEDVVYLRQHGSPIHPAGGMSWLQSVTPETDMEAAALQSETQRWLNGGQPGMVFQAAPATTDAQMKQIQAHLNQSIRGVTNAGKVLLLRDTELKQYGAKPHEMQYVEGLTATEKRVYDAAGIPEPIYRLNSANLASASVANAQYMRYTIAPRLAVLAAELTELLLPHFGVDAGEMWFCFDDPNQDDQIQLAAELRAAEAQGLVTPNEYRAIMDLEALPDEMNLPRYRQTEAPAPMPIFGTPAKADEMPAEEQGSVDVEASVDEDAASVDVQAADKGEVEPEADNDAPQAEPKSWRTRTVEAVVSNRCGCDACGGGERWSGAGAMERLLAKAAAPEADPQPSVAGADASGPSVVGGDAAPVQSKLTFSRKAMVTAWDDATGVQAAVSAIFRSFQAELQSWYAAVVPTMIADHLGANGMPQINNLTAEQQDQLQKMCDKFLSDTIAAGGADGLAKVGVDPDTFTRANEDAIKYIQQRGLELAKSVPDTLKETVNNAITGMMRPDAAGEAQLSIANVRDAVLREVPTLTDYQAERIARTELTNAFNEGNRQGWKQAGVETKQWDVAGGQCELCSALANRYPNPIHIDEMFTDGEWSGQGPTRHPNCRCGLLPGVEFKE